MNRILIKNGHIVDPGSGKDGVWDILVEDGKIREVNRNIKVDNAKVIDCTGKYVFPGFIDMHTHLREPGEEYKEDISTGSNAALHGGFTTILAMPNTKPPIDSRGLVEFVIRRSREEEKSEVFPVGAITKGREGRELAEIGDMREGGAIAFSDDGDWVKNSSIMRRALEYSKIFDTIIISHAEDPDLSRLGVANESTLSYKLGLRGKPKESEYIAIFRDIALSRLTGGRLHIAHVSTRESAQLIQRAKEQGLPVTAEVTPHHLIFTEENLETFDPVYKVNPPLRKNKDREFLIEALKEGIIDVIATDHAPHASFEKEDEFLAAPFGMIWLDFAFSALYTFLIQKNKLDLKTVVQSLTTGPSKILGLNDRGSLEKGKRADIVIFDPEKDIEITRNFLKSKAKNTPLFGKKLKGKVIITIKEGEVFEW
ncbi:MAG TPA: dihydroorotase [candidate division WOR-3 bacterium]|uniref:Dihydroorotase n=1 Tax=candidate division WOR-3 bacterium TaxID=2052148 RepID=A0A7V5LU98_UNCW3|nr:dihydroorotase [candidate division WOR-3 bacterium]